MGNSCSFAVARRGLRVRRDQTAQPLMFLQNYLVDKCSIINLNPLAKRIHKYLNNGLFRVLPVYQTCHMSTFYIFPTAEKKRAEPNLMDGFWTRAFLSLLSKEKCFAKQKIINRSTLVSGNGGKGWVAHENLSSFWAGIWPARALFPRVASRNGPMISSSQWNVSRSDMSHI